MTTDAAKPIHTAFSPALSPQAPLIDLSPVIDFFRSELQRERDRALVAQSAERGARERIVELETKLDAANDARIKALGEANRYAAESGNASAELARLKATMGDASTVPPSPTVGTHYAVIEAYRLLTGHMPAFTPTGWCDSTNSILPASWEFDAERAILRWLNEHRPGG